MIMKQRIGLIVFVLSAAVLVSCARATPEQVDETPKTAVKIGNMTVEEHDSNGRIYPDLMEYCGEYQGSEKEPGTQTVDCEVPLLPRMQVGFGWGAKDLSLLGDNWRAMTWELHIDGHQIDLNEFQQWSTGDQDALFRGWTLDLVDLSPGKHTLRLVWRAETPIDDGFDIYAPGTYENIVNFTVLEE
jgi:hypothetical protein